ncbi:DUF262 domain-containing protein [Streptococcus pantholopis]|uniref:DUF262 domain-containing protein n=1 Tax=Streptococcus pantholopis TaxID=1811193 RepID=A0A172Q740_9STRE|nr:DUF262 domain-containing protein [Streptococcus pantholopis]AND79232.1 hypothetical protein A0O21_03895 [Streptococcus pantholopis]
MENRPEKIPVSKIFSNVRYEVPIYQRNYAWDTVQIEQLIEDIDNSQEDYFLGNLIVNQRDFDHFEVIDGQQRLTTLYLLERYLGISFSEKALQFEAREKANGTLKALSNLDQLEEKFHSDEIKLGFKIIEDYFEKTGLKNRKEEFIQRLDRVNLIRIQVPDKIDLNHYFEIMNTRGEQLEIHEIAKANFLSKLISEKDKLIANDIWEYCSNMDSYIQMNYPQEKRDKIFNSSWSALSDHTVNFDSLKSYYHDTKEFDGRLSLSEIILKGKVGKASQDNQYKDTENERFESIISFPDFLLQVNAALNSANSEDDSSLDDKNFLKTLENNWENEASAKKFLFTLLKARVIFDKYVLKREYLRDYKETGKWSLQSLEKYSDRGGDKPRYVRTFSGGEDKRNQQIRALQSALRITYTSPKTMHWISLILSSYLNDANSDMLGILEDYAQSKIDASGYQKAKGFTFERIVFSYLDYLLYRDGYSYNGQEIVKPLADDWHFQFRSSIEHFYPQYPAEWPKWDDNDLNCFGNLALITVSGNSTFSNATPIGKASTHPAIIEQSLKLRIMAEMMKQNDNNWNQDLAQKHQIEMFEVLGKDSN